MAVTEEADGSVRAGSASINWMEGSWLGGPYKYSTSGLKGKPGFARALVEERARKNKIHCRGGGKGSRGALQKAVAQQKGKKGKDVVCMEELQREKGGCCP